MAASLSTTVERPSPPCAACSASSSARAVAGSLCAAAIVAGAFGFSEEIQSDSSVALLPRASKTPPPEADTPRRLVRRRRVDRIGLLRRRVRMDAVDQHLRGARARLGRDDAARHGADTAQHRVIGAEVVREERVDVVLAQRPVRVRA
jgi:hypothetical protein